MIVYWQKIAIVFALAAAAFMLPVSEVAAAGSTCHFVQSGETLFSIGRRYLVNPYLIATYNNIPNPDYIYAGQMLCIPLHRYGRPYYGVPHPGYQPYPLANYDDGYGYSPGGEPGLATNYQARYDALKRALLDVYQRY